MFETFNKEKVALPFFFSYRKWSRRIINELDTERKVIIFSMDAYFAEHLKGLSYKSAAELLATESIKIKVGVEAYCSLIELNRK